MAKILVNGDLASHPLVKAIPDEQRAGAVDLWVQGTAWLARQRAIGAIHVGSISIPAGVIKGIAGPGGHRAVWALVHAGLWIEGTSLWVHPGRDNMPAAPDGADRRTWCRTVEYGVLHGGRDGLWRIQLRPRRVPIPDSVRALVYARDGYACVICRASDDLTLDHITPWSRGGSDQPENLQTMCRSCNSSKGATV